MRRMPIKAAKDVAKVYGLRQVVLLAWDGKTTHCVTYGTTVEDCDQAAQGGNRVKAALGWPEKLQAEPSRVRQLRDRLAAARIEIKHLKAALNAEADRIAAGRG